MVVIVGFFSYIFIRLLEFFVNIKDEYMDKIRDKINRFLQNYLIEQCNRVSWENSFQVIGWAGFYVKVV